MPANRRKPLPRRRPLLKRKFAPKARESFEEKCMQQIKALRSLEPSERDLRELVEKKLATDLNKREQMLTEVKKNLLRKKPSGTQGIHEKLGALNEAEIGLARVEILRLLAQGKLLTDKEVQSLVKRVNKLKENIKIALGQ